MWKQKKILEKQLKKAGEQQWRDLKVYRVIKDLVDLSTLRVPNRCQVKKSRESGLGKQNRSLIKSRTGCSFQVLSVEAPLKFPV